MISKNLLNYFSIVKEKIESNKSHYVTIRSVYITIMYLKVEYHATDKGIFLCIQS